MPIRLYEYNFPKPFYHGGGGSSGHANNVGGGAAASQQQAKSYAGLGKQLPPEKRLTPDQVIANNAVNPKRILPWNQTEGTPKQRTALFKQYSENCQRCQLAFEAQINGFNVQAAPTNHTKLDSALGMNYSMYAMYHTDMGLPTFMSSVDNTKGSGLYNYEFTNRALYDLTMSEKRTVKTLSKDNNYIIPSVIAGTNGDRASKGTREKEQQAIIEQMKLWGENSRAAITVTWTNGGGHVFNVIYKDGALHYYDGQDASKSSVRYEGNSGVRHYDGLIRTDNSSPQIISDAIKYWKDKGVDVVVPVDDGGTT